MFYPNTLKKNQVHLLLYYYCLCKSFNELFHLLQDNFVPESGCKGIKKINNTQAFLRKKSTEIATFCLFLQKEYKISKYTLFIYMSLLLFLKAAKTFFGDVLLQHITDKKRQTNILYVFYMNLMLVLPYKPNISLIHSILYNKLFAYICKFLYLYIIILADIYA